MLNPTLLDVQNQLLASMSLEVDEINAALDGIEKKSESLDNDVLTFEKKANTLVTISYHMTRLRCKVIRIMTKIKSILNDPATPAALRAGFIKHQEFCSQVSLRLDSLRDDIQVTELCNFHASQL